MFHLHVDPSQTVPLGFTHQNGALTPTNQSAGPEQFQGHLWTWPNPQTAVQAARSSAVAGYLSDLPSGVRGLYGG